MVGRRYSTVLASVVWAATLLSTATEAQNPAGREPASPPRPHQGHGTPTGWRFTWPKGDPAKGRDTFRKFECYACHEVKGESFPAPRDRDAVGPELAAMALLHEPEYFAEAIIHPGAVIESGKGYGAHDSLP